MAESDAMAKLNPVPLTAMDWVAPMALRALSVSTMLPLIAPAETGAKLTERVQVDPAASWKASDEFALVCLQVDALSQSKFALTLGLKPTLGNPNVSGAFPLLAMVMARTPSAVSTLPAPVGVEM